MGNVHILPHNSCLCQSGGVRNISYVKSHNHSGMIWETSFGDTMAGLFLFRMVIFSQWEYLVHFSITRGIYSVQAHDSGVEAVSVYIYINFELGMKACLDKWVLQSMNSDIVAFQQ